ncbi:MAG: hypothetical protein JWR21_61 [Herminiimonas sp.]|nr:hypothetical protein [Herminiimonas sp.]
MDTYRALPDNLKETADAAKIFLGKELGLTHIKIESELHPKIDFRPTFHSIAADKHCICVEVVETLFSPDIEKFVLSCRNHSFPAKLYVAIPRGLFQSIDHKVLRFARENGIAILEVAPPDNATVIANMPLSLSLGGLRSFDLRIDFPPKYRQKLQEAVETFKGGNPAKAVGDVYDELEQLTRRIGQKCETIAGALKKPAQQDWEKGNWNPMLEFLKSNIDKTVTRCPLLTGQLFNRLIGLTEHRNDSAHKPNSIEKLIARDQQLRTRFETAMDELKNWIEASKPLKV